MAIEPGSPEARRDGCRCNPLRQYISQGGQRNYVLARDCPVHSALRGAIPVTPRRLRGDSSTLSLEL